MRDVPQRAFGRRRRRIFRTKARMIPRTGPFHGRRDASRVTRPCSQTLGNVELTFLGHALESFGRVLDTVLAIVAVGRKLPDDLVGTAGGRTSDIAGRKV